MMKPNITLGVILICAAAILAGCMNEGLTGYSPQNDYVAIVTNNRRLYTTNMDGTATNPIEQGEINPNFNVSFDPAGNLLLYAVQNNVCIAASTGDERNCPWFPLPEGANAGILSFLPNRQFMLAYQTGQQHVMNIYNEDGTLNTERSQDNIQHFFFTANAYEPRRDSNGTQWYVNPYRAAQQGALRWVIVQEGVARLYNAITGFEGPQNLGRVNGDALNLLPDRDLRDVTSAALSPDGTKVLFRTTVGGRYNLYLVNLAVDNAPVVTLVNQADFRPQYAFSPDSSQLVYESNIAGRSVWIATADGSNPRMLAENTSLPEWN